MNLIVPKPNLRAKFTKVPSLDLIGKDSDKDGVINGIDCEPFNRKKQGFMHDMVKQIKEKAVDYYENQKTQAAYKRAAENQIAKKEKAAYYQAKEAERLRFAKQKAKIETDHQLKKYKESFTKKPASFSSGFMGGTSEFSGRSAFGGPSVIGSSFFYAKKSEAPKNAEKPKPHKHHKKSKSKHKGQTIVVRLK